jgi:hypothetical protein
LEFLFVIPALFSLYFVIRGQVDKAFLNVYLPCTFMAPYYFHFRLPHLPVLSAGAAALIPIAFSVLLRPKVKWKFRRMDLWVTIFVISYGLSEVLREYSPKDGMILFLTNFIEMFLAYVVGRQVIEPGLRLATVKRIILLFMLQTPFILFEFRMGQNLWLNAARNIFRLYDIGWFVQLRGGTARVSSCFGHAILAGIAFVVAMGLNYYLVQIYKRDKRILGPKMSWLQKYRVPFFALPIFVFMTGSRMPMACAVVCYLLMQIPRFKSLKTGALLIGTILIVGSAFVYSAFEKYTSVSADEVTDEAQSSAIYRKELLEQYQPVLQAGGLLGYGALSHPTVIGLGSVDNNYLLIQLTQGTLGLYTFYLIALDSILSLAFGAARFKNKESLVLNFSLMAALIGTFVALYTVYLGEQVPQILFLLLGWAVSLQDTSVFGQQRAGAAAINDGPEPKFRFRRVVA